MSKKRGRITNTEPFMPFGTDAVSSKKRRPKQPKQHQLQNELLPSTVSSKILKEASFQQKEIHNEKENENNSNDNDSNKTFAFQKFGHNFKDNYDDEEEDVDVFDGFLETQSQYGDYDFESVMYQEDEQLLEAFLSEDDPPQQTLADVIIKRIEEDPKVASGVQSRSKLDDSIKKLYKGVGKLLCKYTSGKVPKALGCPILD